MLERYIELAETLEEVENILYDNEEEFSQFVAPYLNIKAEDIQYPIFYFSSELVEIKFTIDEGVRVSHTVPSEVVLQFVEQKVRDNRDE